jgi:hypothetical protein
MDRTQISLKFKQIAIDNFTNISEDSPIVPLVAVAGSKQDMSVAVLKAGLDWLETHGEALTPIRYGQGKNVRFFNERMRYSGSRLGSFRA